MIKFVGLFSLLSVVNGTFDYHHGVFQEEIGVPVITGQVSSNSKTVEALGKPTLYHDKSITKEVTAPGATGHATSYNRKIDATGKPINLHGIFSTDQSGFRSTEDASSKAITYVPVLPASTKNVVPAEDTKAVITPIITKALCVPIGAYVTHSIPVFPSYGLKIAYGNGFGYGYGYGNGYGYVHGYPYVYGR